MAQTSRGAAIVGRRTEAILAMSAVVTPQVGETTAPEKVIRPSIALARDGTNHEAPIHPATTRSVVIVMPALPEELLFFSLITDSAELRTDNAI